MPCLNYLVMNLSFCILCRAIISLTQFSLNCYDISRIFNHESKIAFFRPNKIQKYFNNTLNVVYSSLGATLCVVSVITWPSTDNLPGRKK